MTHLETLIAEYLDWQGFLVMKNKKVGRLKHGGWEMELDIVGYNPKSGVLLHYEPSIDAIGREKREARYKKSLMLAANTFLLMFSLGSILQATYSSLLSS